MRKIGVIIFACGILFMHSACTSMDQEDPQAGEEVRWWNNNEPYRDNSDITVRPDGSVRRVRTSY